MPKGFTKMNNFHNIENYLEHYGKKGMRWGVRSGSQKGSGAKNKTKSQEIKEARSNVKAMMNEANILGDKARKAKSLKKALDYDRKSNMKMLELLNSEDFFTAKKRTLGEKAYRTALTSGILFTTIGLATASAKYS